MQSTLILNAHEKGELLLGEPLSIVSVNRALTLMLNNKATIVDPSPKYIDVNSTPVNLPYVIKLNKRVEQGAKKSAIFSRRGVLARDGFKCVYCGMKATTIDHVIPESKGGPTSYDNCVAACLPCNRKKEDYYLEELGWELNSSSTIPSWYLLAIYKAPMGSQRDVWTNRLTPYINKVPQAV